MIIKFILFIILIKTYFSFHINYKILLNSGYKQNCVFKIQPINYLYKFQNVKPRKLKYKILSFFSSYFNKESDQYELNLEEKEYLSKLGVNENDDYKDMVKSHEEYIERVNDIKNKLKYKDLFFLLTQKLIHKNLNDFKKKQKFYIFKKDEYITELSIDYVKNSDIEEKYKEKIIQKLCSESSVHKYSVLRIFKRKSLLDIFNISRLIIPISSMGFFLPKMSVFSVVVNMLITAHFLTFKKDQKKKLKVSTLLLTMVPILIHSSFGILCSSLFIQYLKFNIPTFIKRESILSLFVNAQLYIASLIYFTNNDSEEDKNVDKYMNEDIDYDHEFTLR